MLFSDTHSKSPRGVLLNLRAIILALPFLTSPILIINRMGPRWPEGLGPGYDTAFNPALIAEGGRMTTAFVWGCTILLVFIRLRLPTDAALWKRSAALVVSYSLAGFTYVLCFVQTGAGAGEGWMAYGVFLIILAVSLVSIGRYGYDLRRTY